MGGRGMLKRHVEAESPSDGACLRLEACSRHVMNRLMVGCGEQRAACHAVCHAVLRATERTGALHGTLSLADALWRHMRAYA